MSVQEGSLMVLAITDTLNRKLQFYLDWIGRAGTGIDITPLSHTRQNVNDIDRCDGLVLTGGGDIHPKFYGQADALPLARDIDEGRDEFEFAVIKRGLDNSIPILGICRGMQVFNVALGGTMIPDVQTAGYRNHSKNGSSVVDPRHEVRLEPDTILHSIACTMTGDVNTNHHQAVDKLGRGLKSTAWSKDGLVEGLEWKEREGKSFLLLVQWHPERMGDFDNPLSRGLIERFREEVRASSKSSKIISSTP
jgi:putative glutamine amidotransferase